MEELTMMKELEKVLEQFSGAKYLMLTNVQTKGQKDPNYFTVFVNNENTLNEMHLILVDLFKEYEVDVDSGIKIVSKDENHYKLTLFDYTQGVIE
jgi:hypothetical protein